MLGSFPPLGIFHPVGRPQDQQCFPRLEVFPLLGSFPAMPKDVVFGKILGTIEQCRLGTVISSLPSTLEVLRIEVLYIDIAD